MREQEKASYHESTVVDSSKFFFFNERHPEGRERARVFISGRVALKDLVPCMQFSENTRSLAATPALKKAPRRKTQLEITSLAVESVRHSKLTHYLNGRDTHAERTTLHARRKQL